MGIGAVISAQVYVKLIYSVYVSANFLAIFSTIENNRTTHKSRMTTHLISFLGPSLTELDLITNSNKTQNDQKISHLDKISNSWFVIPYFGSYLEKFREVVDVSDMRVAYHQQVKKYH